MLNPGSSGASPVGSPLKWEGFSSDARIAVIQDSDQPRAIVYGGSYVKKGEALIGRCTGVIRSTASEVSSESDEMTAIRAEKNTE
jgi:hypothetical protein